MASIKSISVRDLTGLTNIGGVGEIATVVLTLDEVVTVTNGTINGNTVIPLFRINGTLLDNAFISFVNYNPLAKTITYNVTVPSQQVLSGALSLSGISLNNITISGKQGAFSTTASLTSNYIVDSQNPVINNTATSTSINENTAPAKTILFTTSGADFGSGVANYRVTGNDASLFNVDNKGVVRFKAAPDFETKRLYAFDVVVTDRAGNSASQSYSVTLRNLDEPVSLAKGISGIGNITLASGSLASQGKSILTDFANNSTNSAALTFTSSTVTGIPNFSLVNGTLSGNASAGSYRFTAFASDGSNNGQDASRTYNLVIVDKPTVTDIQIIDSDNTGRAGNVVSIKAILSEAINPLSGTPSISASFTAGRNRFTGTLSNVSSEKGVSVLNFNATLPTGESNSVAMTSLNLGNVSLVGIKSQGTLTNSNVNAIKLSTAFLLDNTAPRITSAATINVNENTPGEIYVARATDANTVRYSITGQGLICST